MELHTVGVDGGYTQADVTEFARAMTGCRIGGQRDGADGRAADLPRQRPRAGRAHGDGRALRRRAARTRPAPSCADLAAKPAHRPLHLRASSPATSSPTIRRRPWSRGWRRPGSAAGGDLAEVAEALIDAPEAWAPQPAKFKTPYEFMVSSYRAAGGQPARLRAARRRS